MTAGTKRGTLVGMEVATDLHALGRAYLDAFVARHGYLGAAGVLLLLAAEMRAGEAEI
jgi:hypothetical protein